MGAKGGEFYNQEVKNRYLNSIKDDKTYKATLSTLLKLSEGERVFDKDIYDMSIKELRETLQILTMNTILSANSTKSKIISYYMWAMENDFSDNVETFSWLKNVNPEIFISKTVLENQYITKSEMYDIVHFCENAQDGAMITLLFNGVEGYEMSELRLLETKDIDFKNNKIKVTGYYYIEDEKRNKYYHREVSLSQVDMDLLEDAMNEEEYFLRAKTNKGKISEHPNVPLVQTEFLLKNTEPISTINPIEKVCEISRQEATRRIRMIANQVNKPQLNSKNLIKSGMLNEMIKLNKDIDSVTDEEITEILKKFNRRINMSSIVGLRKLYKFLLQHDLEVVATV